MTSRRSLVRAAIITAALMLAALFAGPASAAKWNFETLDGDGGASGRVASDVGDYSSAVVWNGQPHVFYDDYAQQVLRHGWWTGVAWQFETLDGNCPSMPCADGRTAFNVGADSTASAVWNGTPHVWYWNQNLGDLRHAWWTGTKWQYETLDGISGADGRIDANVGDAAVVAIWNNQPHVWYRDATNGDLRHAWWTGSKWQFESLDGNCAVQCFDGRTSNQVGRYSTVAVWNKQPHVWYWDQNLSDLRHGWWTGTKWQFETLDGNCASAPCADGRSASQTGFYSAAVVWNGQPHVWYRDFNAGDLRHIWWTGTKWQYETLDGAGGTDGRVDGVVGDEIAVTVWNGVPHVWYDDNDGHDMRHAWWTGAKWQFETLDGNGVTDGRTTDAVGFLTPGSALVWNGQPHLWYRNDTKLDLRHGWYG